MRPALTLLLAIFLILPLTARADLVTPLAPITGQTPWSPRYETQQYQLLEAQAKARRFALAGGEDMAAKANATPNMAFYDVGFYDLDLDLNPMTQILTGTATMTATVTGSQIATVEMNLDNKMTVTGTRSAGVTVPASHGADILTVTLDRLYLPGEEVTVAVDYYGNPVGNYFGWGPYGNEPLIWSLSEPYGAREWWPCKDVNTDKADSVDIRVTVPDDLVVASNGLLEPVTQPEPGKSTYHWRERYPIATYLVAITAHPFQVYHDEYHTAGGDTMPLDYFVVPSRYAEAQAGYAIVPDMITAFAAAFGEYPFVEEKYGHVHFAWGGGMEHQTLSSMTESYYAQWFIAHELGHQWFGDMVTCADFGHIWLNEGFATWAEAYWAEVSQGPAAYQYEMEMARYLGPGTIFVTDLTNVSVIFSVDLSYNKASWIPHMLRHMLGDEDFFAAVRLYLDTRGYGSATTEQFQAILESVSGLDLTAFFQQWVYGQYYPIYDFSYDWWPSGTGYQVTVRVEQTQTLTGLFTMPLDVVIDTAAGPVTFVVENDEAIEFYHFTVDDPVSGVALDPDSWVLREVYYRDASAAEQALPVAAKLVGNVPNPFNPRTEIRFTLPGEQRVRLAVYDLSGRLVKTLVDGPRSGGDHSVPWDGTDRGGRAMPSGSYFARLNAAGVTQVESMALVR